MEQRLTREGTEQSESTRRLEEISKGCRSSGMANHDCPLEDQTLLKDTALGAGTVRAFPGKSNCGEKPLSNTG